MAAFRSALEAGADGIELDVHLSADGKVVVIHDDTVDRTTDGTGSVRDMSADDLRRLDAGSWFAPAFPNERVPLLEEVVELLVNWPGGGRRLLIELKGPFSGVPALSHALLYRLGRLHPAPVYPDLPRAVAAVLAPHQAHIDAGLIIAQSFHLPYLRELRSAMRSLPVLYLSLSTGRGWLEKEDLLGSPLGLAGVSARFRGMSAADVERLRLQQGMVFAWTVSTAEDLCRAANLSLDGLITGRLRQALELLPAPGGPAAAE